MGLPTNVKEELFGAYLWSPLGILPAVVSTPFIALLFGFTEIDNYFWKDARDMMTISLFGVIAGAGAVFLGFWIVGLPVLLVLNKLKKLKFTYFVFLCVFPLLLAAVALDNGYLYFSSYCAFWACAVFWIRLFYLPKRREQASNKRLN